LQDPGAGAGDHRIVEILGDCIAKIEHQTQVVVEKFCEAHPSHAAAIRDRIDALRAGGLVDLPEPPYGEPSSWTASSSRATDGDSPAFERIGPYQPVAELGRGGQAVVLLAKDVRLDRSVALKVLRGFGPRPESVMTRFRREAEVASRLHHPGICAVYDAGVADGVPYIAMRYVEGVTLANKIALARAADPTGPGSSTPRVDVHRMVEIIEKAARALHAAHEAGIIHRDVKPRNIMVTPENEPVILDFGLAGSTAGDAADLTRTGEVFGTPAYMSPEQVLADRGRLDRRTDVYSLAATLYECVTLACPHDAPTREALYHAIQSTEPADPSERNPHIPADLKVVLQVGLEKDRELRYSTALAFAEDLRRVREGAPITARPPGAFGRVMRWAARYPARAALVAVVAIGLPLIAGLGCFIAANRPAILAARQEALRQETEAYLEEGYFDIGHEFQSQAIAAFDQALACMPDSVEAVGGKALVLLEEHRARECIELLDRHQTMVREFPAFLGLEADALRQLGRRGEAGRVEARIPDPSTAFGFFLEGSRLMRGCAHQPDKAVFRRAVEALAQAILTAPHARPIYHHQLAHATGHLAEERPARLAAQSLALRWTDSFRSWWRVGYALQGVDLDQAVSAFRKAVALKPDYFLAHYALGLSLLRMGASDRAVAPLEKAVELAPTDAEAHFSYGVALQKSGRLDEAIGAFERTIALDPDFALAHIQLGDSYLRQNRVDEAVTAYERAADLDPKSSVARSGLGMALSAKRLFPEAIAAYRSALALDPDCAEVHCNLGRALWLHGEPIKALRSIRRGHALGSKMKSWSYPSAEWVRACEKNVLRAVLREGAEPEDVEECVLVAQLLARYEYPLTAARTWKDALEEEPARDGILSEECRFHAARAAALAGSGRGRDARTLPDEERAAWRRQAVVWLGEELTVLERRLSLDETPKRDLILKLQSLKGNQDLGGLRDPASLAGLPDTERRACLALWKAVDALIAKVKKASEPEK